MAELGSSDGEDARSEGEGHSGDEHHDLEMGFGSDGHKAIHPSNVPPKDVILLRNACQCGDIVAAKPLLKPGLVNAILDEVTGDTALHIAAKNGHIPFCSWLLQRGAKNSVVNHTNQSPSAVAAFEMTQDFIESNFRKGLAVRSLSSRRARRVFRAQQARKQQQGHSRELQPV
eukprot:c6209_g1_i3.p1 GENE.c6209_g1_i3~~c6209_g1_i3.p1  ORF type:complete len:181 (-),score=39.02 c6209_g1_i3:5-523(-)